jgi:hypothetical protein
MASSPDSPPRLRIVAAAITPRNRSSLLGRAQLSLVEHALCPLDARASLAGPYIHDSRYWYFDANHHRKEARVHVACPEGLSSTDEFYLWGLLSLTFAQPKPSADFYATPYYCLCQLGCVDHNEDRSGTQNYTLFRAAVSRLATVSYRNDHFYDPIRGEHRDVGFGFLSYSLPIDPQSSRAWRFAWDPIFFEFCQAVAGSLRFDLSTYRALDPACRRIYLLLKKIFWRNEVSPDFDLRDLAVNVIGFSAGQETWKLKQKIIRCLESLLDREIIQLPDGVAEPATLFTKRAKGQYNLRLHRGPHFDATTAAPSAVVTDSALYEPLKTIGLDDGTIGRVIVGYDSRLVAECADMTLAAKERNGESFFTNSPAAYFIDNLKEQAAGRRTPPDWWRELRKEEERRKWQADREERSAASSERFDAALDAYLRTEAREAFHRVMDRVFQDLKTGGQPDHEARRNASYFARTHFVRRFRAEHPEWNDDGPSRAGDSLGL